MPLSVTAGGVTESYSYNGDSQRVKITRSGVTTIFVEGVFEEEIGGTARSSYTLNGQTVAVRETQGSTSTVSSLHSDHLGSVSATTGRNASNAPVWGNLQQYDPWGKVRLTAVQSPPYGTGEAPISQTARGFTGQRLDDSGLMHYNARLYDPLIGRFISADPIIPNLYNPQLRNRFAYALNNPVRYNDPSGHCVEEYEKTLEGCQQYMKDHGWNLIGDWAYDELRLVAQSILDLKTAAGWSVDEYVETMTGGGKYTLNMERQAAYDRDANVPGIARHTPGSTVLTIVIFDILFTYDRLTSLTKLVHEQAHIWDFASGEKMSKGLMKATGSYYDEEGKYVPKGGTASSYHPNALEDWAETVTAAVYPDHRDYVDDTGRSRMGASRRNYVRPFLPNAKLFRGCTSCEKPE